MYQVNDKVLDNSGKIFVIEQIINKDFGNGPSPYFVLKPCFDYDYNEGYRCFIPVDKADNLLRDVLNKEQAEELVDSLKELDTFSNVNPRERKNYFAKLIANGDRVDICKIIKTLILYREERIKLNKPFSDYDRRMLASLSQLFNYEISLAMNMDVCQVKDYVYEKTGLNI